MALASKSESMNSRLPIPLEGSHIMMLYREKNVWLAIGLGILLSGCSSIQISNDDLSVESPTSDRYEYKSFNKEENDINVVLAFSGGGTRAAALSYGVLKGLRDQTIVVNGKTKRLLDEVDVISGVSGGSFTAAYYGLYGDKTFEQYESDFLYHQVSSDLKSIILSPIHWFNGKSRTQEAIDYYNSTIFDDKKFSDIDKSTSPYILINASDLSTGVRFSFTQHYFDLICSDIEDYSIASAVTASSAVPFLFNPVVLKNHDSCDSVSIDDGLFDLNAYRDRNTLTTVEQYQNKDKHKYLHLVDGGITDNLGLVAIYEVAEYIRLQDTRSFKEDISADNKPLIVISVDASTKPELGISAVPDSPSLSQTANSITDIQLHRYNETTKDLIVESIPVWTKRNDGPQSSNVFVEVSFLQTEDPELRYRFNQIRTDLTLEPQDVDILIEEGYKQISNNQALLELIGSLE